MLSLLLIIPILGSMLLIPVSEGVDNQSKMKKIALITSLINFILSIYLWLQFDSSSSQYQFVYEFNELSFCHLNIGVDGLSIYFVLLTTFITPVALLSNYNTINKNLKYYIQVNTGEEEQKSGIAPAQTLEFFQFCKNDLNLDILGLMCIATQGEASGLHFALLKKLADRCNLKNLSMGMSQDYKNALQMGATSIRIGSAIFGARS